MKQTPRLVRLALLAGLAFVSILMPDFSLCQAATHVWSGGVNGNFSNPGNWSSGGVPSIVDSTLVLRFPAGPTKRVVTNDLGSMQVRSIEFSGPDYTIYGAAMTLRPAAGVNNLAATVGGLVSDPVSHAIHCPIVLPNGTSVVSTVSLSGIALNGAVTGPGTLLKLERGGLYFAGNQANTFTGGLQLLGGEVVCGRTSGVSLPGPVYVGRTNVVEDVELVVLTDNQIGDTALVHVAGDGNGIDFRGHSDAIGSLVMDGYSWVTTWDQCTQPGNIVVECSGDLRVNGNITLLSSRTDAYGPSIRGRLQLANTMHNIIVPPNVHLTLAATVISSGTNGGLNFSGGGWITISGNNTFSGPTYLSHIAVSPEHTNAFGAITAPTIVSGTNVEIRLRDETWIGAEPLIVSNDCRMTSIFDNGWRGPVQVATNKTLRIDSGTGNSWPESITLGGVLSGAGNIVLNVEEATISGSAPNSLSGAIEPTHRCHLLLNKASGNAIAGELRLAGAASSTHTNVAWAAPNQLSDTARIVFASGYSWSGNLSLNDFSDTVGSIEGYNGKIECGTGRLTVGGNNRSTCYFGTIRGAGGLTTNLVKIGTGVLILAGSHQLAGKTVIDGGWLIVSNATGLGPVHVNSGARLAGAGSLGVLSASGTGRVEPGLKQGDLQYGTLAPAFFNLGGGVYRCGLGGATSGFNCDQIVTSGPLFLSGTTLELSTLAVPTGSNSFTIINVTNTGLTLGAFNGLSEGATFLSLDGHQFRITYQGGTGNDVVVTRVDEVPLPAQIEGITSWGDGQIRIEATGRPGRSYLVVATTNLVPPNWIPIGSTTADGNGALEFIDVDAPNFTTRFYRFVIP